MWCEMCIQKAALSWVGLPGFCSRGKESVRKTGT